jgi:predicted secreted protein
MKLSNVRDRLPLLLSFLTIGWFAQPALAGDSAQLNVIGYSEDGKVFAFEEYGILDGSGGAYSNYYFLDTTADKFLPGTPIKVQTDQEESVAKIRGQAHRKAEPLIKQYNLEDNPGYLLTYNPVSEAESDPHRVRYYGYPSSPPRAQTYTLVLTEKPFPASKDCLNMTGNFSGFRLAFAEALSEPSNRVIYEDKQIPASRNCPNGYRIGAVIAGETDNAPMVAMIQVSSFGFEGNDERWIAVPFRLFEEQ